MAHSFQQDGQLKVPNLEIQMEAASGIEPKYTDLRTAAYCTRGFRPHASAIRLLAAETSPSPPRPIPAEKQKCPRAVPEGVAALQTCRCHRRAMPLDDGEVGSGNTGQAFTAFTAGSAG